MSVLQKNIFFAKETIYLRKQGKNFLELSFVKSNTMKTLSNEIETLCSETGWAISYTPYRIVRLRLSAISSFGILHIKFEEQRLWMVWFLHTLPICQTHLSPFDIICDSFRHGLLFKLMIL